MELLLLPFLAFLPSVAPSCLARPQLCTSKAPGSGMEAPLESLQVSPDFSVLVDHYPSYPSASSSCLERCHSGIMHLPSKGTGK